MHARSNGFHIAALIAVLLSSTAHAAPPIVPNPGGSTVVENSTTSSYVFQDTDITQVVDDYATTVSTFLNGSELSSVSLPAAYSDATVQAAVTAADATLAGDGATIGAPQLSSNTSVLESALTAAPVVTCGPCTQPTGDSTVTSTMTVGPAQIMVGDNLSDIFIVNTGQTAFDINTDTQYFITRDIVTTDTYLISQTYDILGSTAAASVPEPASAALVLLGLGMMWGSRRRR